MRIKKNGKVITLTESDLKRIVKRTLSEQDIDVEPNYEDGRVDIPLPGKDPVQRDVPHCGTLMKSPPKGKMGGSETLELNGKVVIEYNMTVAPGNRSYMVSVNGKQYCKIK